MAVNHRYIDVDTASDFEPTRGRWQRVLVGSVSLVSAGAVLVGGSTVLRESGNQGQGVQASPALSDGGAVQLSGEYGGLLSKASLKPLEPLNDGNVCEVNEELFAGLCYKKCAALTHGEAPIRTSAWTCCTSHPCTPFNEKGKIGTTVLCNGYDVSGNDGCPHKPGACLVDEEMVMGVCYKQCSRLTNGEFPHRFGPATCCKTKGLGCLNLKNDKSSQAFAVGGGGGDNDATTPSSVHLPQKSLTESSAPHKVYQVWKPMPEKSSKSSPAMPVKTEDLLPKESMNDGNPCLDTEELYGGLCYAKCGALTNGKAPHRTSSWTCCESEPCNIFNEHGSLGTHLLCNGYDVSASGGCPHKPGACLVDEELFYGVCYKTCSSLTNGDFPHRFAAATCCKTKGLGCLNIRNDRTSKAFAVGGGAGDHSDLTPAESHLPEQRLTESGQAASTRPALKFRAPVPTNQNDFVVGRNEATHLRKRK